jgi:hypothetical protein
MDGLDGVITLEVPITGAETTTTYIGDTTGNYPRAVWLEKGFIWEVVDFAMTAATNYTAAASFYKFYLKDASGNTICTLTETIAVNPATANDNAPVDAYKRIDCESAGSYLQVVPVQSSAGLLMNGLKAIIRVKKLRNA